MFPTKMASSYGYTVKLLECSTVTLSMVFVPQNTKRNKKSCGRRRRKRRSLGFRTSLSKIAVLRGLAATAESLGNADVVQKKLESSANGADANTSCGCQLLLNTGQNDAHEYVIVRAAKLVSAKGARTRQSFEYALESPTHEYVILRAPPNWQARAKSHFRERVILERFQKTA